MEAYLYILQSEKNKRKYVGVTFNVANRLARHNEGRVLSTTKDAPCQLVYTEKNRSLAAARKREKFMKSGCGRHLVHSLSSFK